MEALIAMTMEPSANVTQNSAVSAGINLNTDVFDANPGLSAQLRRGALKNMQMVVDDDLFTTRQDGVVATIRSSEPGVVIIIPTGHECSTERVAQTEMSLQSIAEQIRRGFSHPVGVLISDNGLLAEHRDRIAQTAKRLGLNFHFVDAPAHSREEHNSQFALNAAIRELKGLAGDPASSRVWRADAVALLDDDAAFGPFSLRTMYETLVHHRDAVAVEGTGRASHDLRADFDSVMDEHPLPPDVETILDSARRMPALWRNGRLDLSSIVAFSGDVTLKTACLLLQRMVLEQVTRNGNDAFVRYPHGSFGDMALGASLARHGEIYQNPLADYMEQKSCLSSRICSQKLRWGRDHVHAFNDFVELGVVEPGIHVLEPVWSGGAYVWRQWTIPDTHSTGVVVAPAQLGRIAAFLERQLGTESKLPMEDPALAKEKLGVGVGVVKAILEKVAGEKRIAETLGGPQRQEIRHDLPSPWRVMPVHPRWGADALVSQLAGNIAGMGEIQELFPGEIPSRFVIGVRQYARWSKEPF